MVSGINPILTQPRTTYLFQFGPPELHVLKNPLEVMSSIDVYKIKVIVFVIVNAVCGEVATDMNVALPWLQVFHRRGIYLILLGLSFVRYVFVIFLLCPNVNEMIFSIGRPCRKQCL